MAEDVYHFRPGGYYKGEELPSATNFWREENDPSEGGHMTRPSQGTLFDPEAHEAKVRQQLGARRMEGFDPWGDEGNVERANEIRNAALKQSVIPTSHLQPRPGREESAFVVEEGLQSKGALGHYTGPADKYRADYVTVDPEGPDPSDTAIHEMGHRHHLGTTTSFDPRTTHPRGKFPDPLMEAVADAYEDRYGGPSNSQVREMSRWQESGAGPFRAYQHTGYSTHPEVSAERGWDLQDRAVYAASRAHFSETGEIPAYVPRGPHVMENTADSPVDRRLKGDPTLDATLHSLVSSSPHAVQALRQTGLKDVAGEAFRRHRDRQLLTQGQNVQEALFHEMRGSQTGKLRGFVQNPDIMPDDDSLMTRLNRNSQEMDAIDARAGEFTFPKHMSVNQFGETPRTARDVRETLGVATRHANKMGFRT